MTYNSFMKNNNTNKQLNFQRMDSKEFINYIQHNDLNIKDSNSQTPLLYAIENNKEKKLHISHEIFNKLINNSNYDKSKETISAISNNKTQNLNFSESMFEQLIFNSDNMFINNFGWNAFMYVIENYKTEKLNISKKALDYLIKTSNFNIKDFYGITPLMVIINQKGYGNNPLTEEQLKHIINNSNMETITKDGMSHLFYALYKIKQSKSISIGHKNWLHLFNNSKINQKNTRNETLPSLFAQNLKENYPFLFSTHEIKKIYEKIDQAFLTKEEDLIIKSHITSQHKYYY